MRKLALLAAAMSIGLPMFVQSGVANASDWGFSVSYGSQPADWNGGYRGGYGHRDEIMSRSRIRDIVRGNYDNVHDIQLHGRTYVLQARNYTGRPVVMSLDACSGALIEIHYTDNADWRYEDRSRGWNGDRDADWRRPPPPPSYDDTDWRGGDDGYHR